LFEIKENYFDKTKNQMVKSKIEKVVIGDLEYVMKLIHFKNILFMKKEKIKYGYPI